MRELVDNVKDEALILLSDIQDGLPYEDLEERIKEVLLLIEYLEDNINDDDTSVFFEDQDNDHSW